MENVIIYGVDDIPKRLEIEYLLNNDKYRILAYSDSYHSYSHFGGRLFIPVEKLIDYEFKYVIVACDTLPVYENIKRTLLGNGVPENKIIRHYFFKYSDRWSNYYLDELFTKPPLFYEGIILGSSYALRGINSSCLSKCFCNLGWHGLDLYYFYKLLKYLKQTASEKMKRVKYVILALPYYIFNNDMSLSLYQLRKGQIWALNHLNDYHNMDKLQEFPEYQRLYKINKDLFGKVLIENSLAAWAGNDRKRFSGGGRKQ